MTNERESVQRLLHVLASAGIALTLVVIAASGYLRLAQAGLSCADWPSCYGRIDPELATSALTRVARLAHRIAAGALGVILIAVVLIGVAQRPRLARQTVAGAAVLLIAAGLAALGSQIATHVGAPLPIVTLANLGGGFAILAILVALRLTTMRAGWREVAPPAWCRAVAALALFAVCVQIALGALVSAEFAGLACPDFPACGARWPQSGVAATLDPFRELDIGADGTIARPPALVALHFMHRVTAIAVAVLVAALVAGLSRIGHAARRAALTGAALLLLQLALGAAAVLARLPLALVLAHNLSAALLLMWLVKANIDLNRTEAR